MYPRLPFALLILLICSSCIKHQYVTISSDLSKKENGEIYFENDSVSVIFFFVGKNCPARIRVYNKLSIPLFVSWEQSSFIVGQHSVSLYQNIAPLSASLNGVNYNLSSVSLSSADINGAIRLPAATGFIPSGTWIEAAPINLKSGFITLPASELKKKNLRGYSGQVPVRYKEFEQGQSPFKFQAYLTISINADFSNPIVLQNHFWISKISQGMTKSQSIAEYNKRQDGFDLQKITDFGSFLTVVGVLSLVIFGAAGNSN